MDVSDRAAQDVFYAEKGVRTGSVIKNAEGWLVTPAGANDTPKPQNKPWMFRKYEMCAVCADKGSERILGCVTWGISTDKDGKPKAEFAQASGQDASDTWYQAVGQWNNEAATTLPMVAGGRNTFDIKKK